MPHVSKIVFDLFLAVQRQFVLHHHAGEGETGLFAIGQHLGGRFKRIGHIHIARALFAKVFFVNDKAAADGVVGFTVDLFFAAPGVDCHTVFMQRQVVATKTHPVILREVHFVLTVSQQQTTARFHVADKCRNGININCVRHIARQTHNNGDIGVVAFTR